MRTNIVLDDSLVKKALSVSHATTKKEIVHQALQEFVANHSRKNLAEIRGKIRFRAGYDYKKLRRAKKP